MSNLDLSRLTDPDVLRWRKRLERCLRDAPKGVHLYGMDNDLLIVTAACTADMEDGTKPGGWDLGSYSQDPPPWLSVSDPGGTYRDSGGF